MRENTGLSTQSKRFFLNSEAQNPPQKTAFHALASNSAYVSVKNIKPQYIIS